MSDTSQAVVLVELSLAGATAAIEADHALMESQKTHWVCSIRQIARALDRPVESLPARWVALRQRVDELHHAQLGVTSKTLANHKANLRAALNWIAGTRDVPARGTPFLTAWSDLRSRLSDRGLRARLSGLMRFASAKGVGPEDLRDEHLRAYLRYRTETTALQGGIAAHRSIARSWNRCVEEVEGWPVHRLREPDLPVRQNGPDYENLPEGLRQDLEAYLDGLAKVRRGKDGRRIQPARPSTIATRRAELLAAIRKAVAIGVPLSSLTSLAAFLHPDVAGAVVDAYWEDNGEEPRTYTIDLAWKLHAIARGLGCLDETALERLDDMRTALEGYRQAGLTDKNLRLIRQVLAGSTWADVARHPWQLMRQAHAQKEQAPVKAALKAQVAVGIALLTVAPVRLGNLVRIKLEENLIRPGGRLDRYWLVFPHYDVKNRIKLEFPLNQRVTELIEEYVHDFRPGLMRGSNEAWLFPGESGGHKTDSMFSGQITDAVLKATGLRITAHQFRHAAAAVILRTDPGNYEFVRRVLGHKTILTTTRFYIGLEATQANERFASIVHDQVTFDPE